MKSLPNILAWNSRDLEAVRFQTGIKILGFFSNKRVNLKLQRKKEKKSEKAKNSDRIETSDFVIGNNTVRKLTDLGNVLESWRTLKVGSFKYEKGKIKAVKTINSHFLQ